MKKTITTLVICLLVFNALNAQNWITSLEDGKKIALASNKLILVDFWATWCGPCKRMDSESWSKADVHALMQNYVPVKIDLDKNKGLAVKYGVKGIPYIFIMDGNGKVIYQQMSYKRKSEVISLLNKYALNTQFLSQDLINYFKTNNFANTFRLAAKYQDYSMHLDNSLQFEFLEVSDTYFKEAKQSLKNSKLKNKEYFIQKMELYDIQKNLILDKSKKALKQLDKIKKESIDKKNISFYNLLNYVALTDVGNTEKATTVSILLSEIDLKKANLFLNHN